MTIRRCDIADDPGAVSRGEVVPTDWNTVADQLNLLGTSSTLNFDTDGTLAADSDLLLATQKAVKTYIDTHAVTDALRYKGVIDCSGNPNYPSAIVGDTYKISVAGKLGGASGAVVEVNDLVICSVANAGGTQASVGADFDIVQTNIDGAVIGPASATSTAIAIYNGTTGKIIQNSAATIAAGVITATGFVGPITATTVNNVTITAPAGGSTLTIANGKVLTISNTITLTGTDGVSMNVSNNKLHSCGFSTTSPTVAQQGTFYVCPYAGTITAWNIVVDAGTATVKVWKIATGTAAPTSSNAINTSGIAISSNTAIRSTDVTDFTTITVTANDIFGFEITAVSGVTRISFSLEITAT